MKQDLEQGKAFTVFHDGMRKRQLGDPRREARVVDLEALFHVEAGQRGKIMRPEAAE